MNTILVMKYVKDVGQRRIPERSVPLLTSNGWLVVGVYNKDRIQADLYEDCLVQNYTHPRVGLIKACR